MKKQLAVLFLSALMLAGCGGSDSSGSETVATSSREDISAQQEENPTEKTPVEGFKVDGTKLLDANGNEFVMRGINHAHSWFAGEDVYALDAISKTGANVVRIVLADGDQWKRDSADTISTLIETCTLRDMVVILEVHDATGKDDISWLQNAADFWIEVKDALIGTEDRVILNIANEWVGQWQTKTWAKGYKQVIPQLREAGIKNTIMVDAAGWGQYGKSIKDKGMEVFESDPDRNTMFSIHMYGSAGGTPQKIEENLTGVTDQNLCVCVGEFGYNHSDGDVDEAYIMKYCEENDIGWLGWSWKGNGGGVEYLDLALDWDGLELSPEWGEVLVNGENGIKETSEKCSVFG
ncbi:MAG: cellulase family glycosylhydrolase [Ruminococcus sp.]|nr:cellulase family glycosylhydrolase [Ruminococcus sp.]